MGVIVHIPYVAIEIAFLLFSVPGNMFMLVVFLKEWVKNKRLCITHQLLGGISFCNILHAVLKVSMYTYFEVRGLPAFLQEFVSFLMLFVISCNLWFSTWLFVHFCLKTVGINQRVYIYLQRSFPKILPWILLLSVLWSVIFNIHIKWYMGNSSSLSYSCSSHNVSMNSTLKGIPYQYNLTVFSIHIPFILSFGSALTSIFYLYRHLTRVRDNAEGARPSSVEAHVSAARTIASMLILNALYFIYFSLYASGTCNTNLLYFAFMLGSGCNSLAPFILIKGNRKLNNALAESRAFCLCAR